MIGDRVARDSSDGPTRDNRLVRLRRAGTALVCAAVLASGVRSLACVYVPLRARAGARRMAYLEEKRELPPAIADAIDRGHVVPGMDPEQVWVVLGDPVRQTSYPGPPVVEVWIYPVHRFHQDPVHSHGASLFRLVFLDGYLRVIEPI